MPAIIFTNEQIQEIMSRTEQAITTLSAQPEFASILGKPNVAKCWSCRIGLNIALYAIIFGVVAALIAGEVFTEGAITAAVAPILAAISVATGLSGAAVTAIFIGVLAGGGVATETAVVEIILELCKAMKACK